MQLVPEQDFKIGLPPKIMKALISFGTRTLVVRNFESRVPVHCKHSIWCNPVVNTNKSIYLRSPL